MFLIVGLGNPGEKYKNTRHNTGFQAVDTLRKRNNFPEFELSKKFNSLISEASIDNKKIILANPQTFMNNSGKAAASLVNFYKIKNLFVVHDDIDLALEKIRIVKNRGAAGHKGVESIIKEIGTKNFIRFRIGIRPRIKNQELRIKNPEKFVLQKFSKEEEKIVKEITEKTAEAIELFLKQGLEKAMNEYNR